MASNDSDRALRLEQEHRAWILRQRGRSQCAIAEELGISQPTVSRMLARIHRRVLKALTKRVELQKVESTQVLEHVRDEALQAWERSKKPRTRATKRSGGTGAGGAESTVQQAEDRVGDPAFLDRAMAADREIRGIWGVNEPPKRPSDDDTSGNTVSAVAARIKAAGEAFEERERQREPDPGRRGDEVPEEPGPVQ